MSGNPIPRLLSSRFSILAGGQISLIFFALYQAIGPYKEEAFEGELRNDKIYEALLPIENMKLLKIIYHKSFASGLSLEEFDQTVKQYEKR